MKNGSWKTVSLFDICSPKQWATIPQKDFVESGYPVFGANGKVGFYTEFNHEHPTILVTCRGATCGTINVCDPKSYVTGNAMALDDLDESRVDLGFLVYALRQNGLSKAITGTAQPQITRTSLKAVRVSFPPLDEQKRIAEVLDRAEALRARRRAALALLDELTQSIFLDMFGDPVVNPKGWTKTLLGEQLTYQRYGPRFYNEKYSEEGVRIVRITDLDSFGVLTFDNMPRQDVNDEEREKFLLKPGDIIFARTGATVGKVALIKEGDPECIAGAYFITLRFSPEIHPTYARAVLTSKSIQAIVWVRSQQSAQQNFSGPGLRALPMPVPPIELQRDFAKRVEQIHALKKINESHLEAIDELFASLQSRAFKGELFADSREPVAAD